LLIPKTWKQEWIPTRSHCFNVKEPHKALLASLLLILSFARIDKLSQKRLYKKDYFAKRRKSLIMTRQQHAVCASIPLLAYIVLATSVTGFQATGRANGFNRLSLSSIYFRRKLNSNITAATNTPSQAPVSFAIDTPSPTSAVPTYKPTTEKPTRPPTPNPSRRQTRAPTKPPTASPTSPSNLAPVRVSWGNQETSTPTSSPTPAPTPDDIITVTLAPTPSPQKFSQSIPNLTTTFSGSKVLPMSPEEVAMWEAITSQRVTDFWEHSSLIDNLQVITRLTGQSPAYVENAQGEGASYTTNDGNNRTFRNTRRLQGAVKLTLTFSQEIQYFAPVSSSTTARTIVTQPFNTFSKRQEYKSMLLSANIPALEGLETVYIVDVYELPSAAEEPKISSKPEWMTYIIYGAIGAAGLLLIAVALACYCHSTSKKKLRKKENHQDAAKKSSNLGPVPPAGLKPGNDARVQSIIELEMRDDDISTLGDPLSPYDKSWLAKLNQSQEERSINEHTVGPSIIHDFDYTKTFGGKFDTGGANTVDRSLSKRSTKGHHPNALGASHSGDDEYSFDEAFAPPSGIAGSDVMQQERIEIFAPPGKLGVVIDTFDNGQPGVNAIRGDSVLKDKLRVGDVLIEFDGEDTTNMTALEVSRMIGSRSSNAVRKLVFVRNLNAMF